MGSGERNAPNGHSDHAHKICRQLQVLYPYTHPDDPPRTVLGQDAGMLDDVKVTMKCNRVTQSACFTRQAGRRHASGMVASMSMDAYVYLRACDLAVTAGKEFWGVG
jgi:hypothetical protein